MIYLFLSRKKPRLLLINPWIYDFTAFDFWSKPLGLLYIASILRELGYQINFIDCMDRYDADLLRWQGKTPSRNKRFGTGSFQKEKVEKPKILKSIPRNYYQYGITKNIFYNKLKKVNKPDAILITSVMTYWYPGVFEVIKLAKDIFPGSPIILGGIYATLCNEHAQQYSGADYTLKGSSIIRLLKLLEDILHKHSKNCSDKNIAKNFNSYPLPAWDLYHNLDYICLVSGIGCPYSCSYCASNLINPVLNFREPSKIVAEIKYWFDIRGVKDFVFYDDALLINSSKHFIPIMQKLLQLNLKISFHTPNALHAALIDKDTAELMYANNFKSIWHGFESSDCVFQENTGGKINNADFEKAIKNLLNAGFSSRQINAYVLVGLPGQRYNNVLDSISFVFKTGIKPYLAKYSPIPGTKIWGEALLEYGWEEPVDPVLHNDALMPYFSPNINEQQYYELKKIIKNYKI
ncbi:MAG: radical SAM protein [Atribacterota bacterium]|nr:radical SAM protein [Atribacterota bacterium]